MPLQDSGNIDTPFDDSLQKLNDYLYECYPTLSASFNKQNVPLFMEVAKEALYTDTQTTEEELVDIIHAELRKSEGRKTSALDIVRALNNIEANKEQANQNAKNEILQNIDKKLSNKKTITYPINGFVLGYIGGLIMTSIAPTGEGPLANYVFTPLLPALLFTTFGFLFSTSSNNQKKIEKERANHDVDARAEQLFQKSLPALKDSFAKITDRVLEADYEAKPGTVQLKFKPL